MADSSLSLADSHPLETSWTLWFDGGAKKDQKSKISQSNWDQLLNQILTFDTVPLFWGLFNNIAEPSLLVLGSNYHLFKTGIQPKWEDPANNEGGKWQITIPKAKRANLDVMWLHSVMMLVGEVLDPDAAKDVAGIVVSVRKVNDRIAIWTKTAANQALQESLCKKWLEVIAAANIGDKWKVEYTVHKEAMAMTSHAMKPRYTVN